jgi:hypothetical protein
MKHSPRALHRSCYSGTLFQRAEARQDEFLRTEILSLNRIRLTALPLPCKIGPLLRLPVTPAARGSGLAEAGGSGTSETEGD